MSPRVRRAGGFTLLEVMVALALLTGAVLTTAQVFLVTARAAQLSRATSLSTLLAAAKIEQLRGLAWGYDLAGQQVEDTETDIAASPETTTGGPGLTPSPPGALSANLAGFVDYLDETGAWMGAGAAPPAGSTYIRRWSIRGASSRGGAPGSSEIEVAEILSIRMRRPS